MAQQYSFDALSRWVVAAVVACVPLLASSVACQSGSDEDKGTGESEPSEGAAGSASPVTIDVPPRVDSRPSPIGSGGAVGDGVRPAAAAAGSPAGPPDPVPAGASAGAAGASGSGVEVTQAFEACTTTEGSYGANCDIIYVTARQASPSRCVQLTIDNCGGYNSQGLPVDAPTSWRLASGSIGSNSNDCDLGVFDPEKTGVADAEGTITWNELTSRPTELVLDLTLSPSSSARDTTSVRVATSEPLNPGDCEP
jgi:hypothetical protein